MANESVYTVGEMANELKNVFEKLSNDFKGFNWVLLSKQLYSAYSYNEFAEYPQVDKFHEILEKIGYTYVYYCREYVEMLGKEAIGLCVDYGTKNIFYGLYNDLAISD